MQQVERWSWVTTSIIDSKPSVIVLWVQDKGETIMDLRHQLVGLRSDDREGLTVWTHILNRLSETFRRNSPQLPTLLAARRKLGLLPRG
jgi:hypothetical protein